MRGHSASNLRDQLCGELLLELLCAGASYHASAAGCAGSSAGGECTDAAEHAGGARRESGGCVRLSGGFRRTDMLRGRQRDLLLLGDIAGELALHQAGEPIATARRVPRSRCGIQFSVCRSSLLVCGVLHGGRNLRCRMLRSAGISLCSGRLASWAAAVGYDRHADRRGHCGRFGPVGQIRSPARSAAVDRMRHGGCGSVYSLDRGATHSSRGVARVGWHGARSCRGRACGGGDVAGRDSAGIARTREWSSGGAHFARAIGGHAAFWSLGGTVGHPRRIRAERGPVVRDWSLRAFAKIDKMSYDRAKDSPCHNQNRT